MLTDFLACIAGIGVVLTVLGVVAKFGETYSRAKYQRRAGR